MGKKLQSTSSIDIDLTHGDYITIAEMAGTSAAYVRQIFIGERNADSPTGQRIIQVAKALVQTRENLAELVKLNGENFSTSKNYMIPVNKPLRK